MSSGQISANLKAIYGDLATPIMAPTVCHEETPDGVLLKMVNRSCSVEEFDFAARNVATRDLLPALKWAINRGYSQAVEGILVNTHRREGAAELFEEAACQATGASRSLKEGPYQGLLKSLRLLFDAGMPASRRLLFIAVQLGDVGVARMLLERGAPLGADHAEIGEIWAYAARLDHHHPDLLSMLRIAITARGIRVSDVDRAYTLKSDGLDPSDIRNAAGWYEGPVA